MQHVQKFLATPMARLNDVHTLTYAHVRVCYSKIACCFVPCLAAFAATSVIIFGIENKNKFDQDDAKGYYDWAYHVALATGAFGVLATLSAGASIHAIGKDRPVSEQ